MERSIALDSHRSSALPVVSASKAKSIPLAGLSSVNELVAALKTTILTEHQPVPAPLHDDSAVKRGLMSPLAVSVIGTGVCATDPAAIVARPAGSGCEGVGELLAA